MDVINVIPVLEIMKIINVPIIVGHVPIIILISHVCDGRYQTSSFEHRRLFEDTIH